MKEGCELALLKCRNIYFLRSIATHIIQFFPQFLRNYTLHKFFRLASYFVKACPLLEAVSSDKHPCVGEKARAMLIRFSTYFLLSSKRRLSTL